MALAAAAILSVLSALDVVHGDPLAASVLAVLALVGVTLVKDRESRERLLRTLAKLEERTESGTGTYLRAETLPRLSEGGLRRREVWIEIIDPSEVEVCHIYANYRRRLRHPRSVGQRPEEWTLRRVRTEAYASVFAAAWFAQHRHLSINIALSKQLTTTFRYELSSEFLLMNDEAEQWALKADAHTSTYDCFYEDLARSFEQARRLDLSELAPLPASSVTSNDVRAVLEALGLVPDPLPPRMFSSILHQAISEAHAVRLGFPKGGARNPYPKGQQPSRSASWATAS